MAFRSYRVIALIPARGGSKGIRRKNLANVLGMPLLSYTASAARSSTYIDEVFLSSDDEEILTVGKKQNLNVIRRPPEISTDDATATEVIKHFINHISVSQPTSDLYIVYLQPTSPLRTHTHIDDAFSLLQKNESSHSLVSVTALQKSPFKSFIIDPSGNLKSLLDEKDTNQNRQKLPQAYIANGAIYIFRVSDFLLKHGIPSNGSVPYIMSEDDSVDIDKKDDLRIVEERLRSANAKISNRE